MIKKIGRTSFSLLMILAVLFVYVVTPIPVEAAQIKDPQTLGDLQNNLADLKKQKADNESQQQKTKEEINAKKAAIKKSRR